MKDSTVLLIAGAAALGIYLYANRDSSAWSSVGGVATRYADAETQAPQNVSAKDVNVKTDVPFFVVQGAGTTTPSGYSATYNYIPSTGILTTPRGGYSVAPSKVQALVNQVQAQTIANSNAQIARNTFLAPGQRTITNPYTGKKLVY